MDLRGNGCLVLMAVKEEKEEEKSKQQKLGVGRSGD